VSIAGSLRKRRRGDSKELLLGVLLLFAVMVGRLSLEVEGCWAEMLLLLLLLEEEALLLMVLVVRR